MTEKIKVFCEEEKRYETLIDLIVSAAYYRPEGVIKRTEIRFRERLNGLEFIFPMYCPEIYQDYLKQKFSKIRIEHLGI